MLWLHQVSGLPCATAVDSASSLGDHFHTSICPNAISNRSSQLLCNTTIPCIIQVQTKVTHTHQASCASRLAIVQDSACMCNSKSSKSMNAPCDDSGCLLVLVYRVLFFLTIALAPVMALLKHQWKLYHRSIMCSDPLRRSAVTMKMACR